MPPYEATLTKNLRDAGAIIIAKTNMTELANWVAAGCPAITTGSPAMDSIPTIRGPIRARAPNDGRPALNAGGSSSGAGTAANFWAANVGTETSGSILTPANQTMLVGIKPTVGRISRYGIIPITADQDTAGPDGEDRRGRRDSARRARRRRARSARSCDDARAPRPNSDYTRFLNRAGLAGARIGVPRAWFVDEPRHGALLRDAIAQLATGRDHRRSG